jgi:CheY-like chemotaxis protein
VTRFTVVNDEWRSGPVTLATVLADGSTTGARILVVDDEEAIAELLTTALRYTGFEVAVARAGFEALQIAATFSPDLVVLDIMLPDLDGYEVCRRLRQDGDLVPIVFLTARDAEDDRIRGFVQGGDGYWRILINGEGRRTFHAPCSWTRPTTSVTNTRGGVPRGFDDS